MFKRSTIKVLVSDVIVLFVKRLVTVLATEPVQRSAQVSHVRREMVLPLVASIALVAGVVA